MRSYVRPYFNTAGVLLRRRNLDTWVAQGEDDVRNSGRRQPSRRKTSKETNPADPLVSDFLPPEL